MQHEVDRDDFLKNPIDAGLDPRSMRVEELLAERIGSVSAHENEKQA
jgi:hypothetical protein